MKKQQWRYSAQRAFGRHSAQCAFGMFLLGLVSLSSPVLASEWRHALSLMGTPKYSASFSHFDYVNPQAPKGGVLRLAEPGTYDNFNPIAPRGNSVEGLELVYERLSTASLDEVGTEYGLLAEAVRVADDLSSVSYRLRPEAKWHDGKPLSVEDVIWTFTQIKAHNPQMSLYYAQVTEAKATGPREITFTFSVKGNRELPQIIGQMPVLPKHWWTAPDEDGRPRDVSLGLSRPGLGSGPYRVKSYKLGHHVEYERVKDYWGQSLAVNKGRHNFDGLRYDYFLDETVLVESFKKDAYDVRLENIAANWAKAYTFPARDKGWARLDTFPDQAHGVMQAFVFNLRRPLFQDMRVRQAFNLVFNFEDMNRILFHDQYKRVDSYFSNTELASRGLPEGAELALLTPYRDQLPASVFTTPYANPVHDSPQKEREHMREALRLLGEAGWQLAPDGRERSKRHLRNAAGDTFKVEFLLSSPSFERVVNTYRAVLERLGVEVNVRVVDSSQYINRVRSRDYDIIVHSWRQSLSPGNEQREYWSSTSADREGSRNMIGLKNSVVDALIDKVIFAKDRQELLTATRALDRVLLHMHLVVPQWSSPVIRMARWDRLGHPTPLPAYSIGFPDIWWYDAAKAQAIEAQRKP